MKSAFKKKHRMQAYAYVLGQMEQSPEKGSNGVCWILKDFLKRKLRYNRDKFYFSKGPSNFPELWAQRSEGVEHVLDSWFNSNKERIEALKNILKIKE